MSESIRWLGLSFSISLLLVDATIANAQGNQVKMGELIEGQWAEARTDDPFTNQGRPVQLWLPEGTLIYDIQESDRGKKFRSATTYHGYPVTLWLQPKPEEEKYKYALLRPPLEPGRFRLNQSVFCPAEGNAIVPEKDKLCRSGLLPIGEGWTFSFVKDGTNPRYEVTAVLDEATQKEIDGGRLSYSFFVYENEIEDYERQGILFRLDKPYPQQRYEFLESNYFPCNTTQTFESRKEEIQEKYAKATLGGGFDFWGWFRTTVETGTGYQDQESSVEKTTTTISSSESSIFRQWGVIRQDSAEGVPFYIEKSFECQSGAGTNNAGDRILKVQITIWDPEYDENQTYEFDNPARFVEMDEEIYRYHQRPIFISINDPTQQALILKDLVEKEEISFSLAVFLYAQINNSCSRKNRENKKCQNAITLNLN